MLRASRWHDAAQTHFPPRLRKSQWHCDITNEILPRGLPTHLPRQIRMALRHRESNFATWSTHTLEANISHDTSTTNHPAHQRHTAFTPACFALPSGTVALRHHERRVATRSAHTLQAFRTRLPPTVTRKVSKMSVSYETSSKTHMSKSAKRAFRTRLPPKVKREHPSEHTHHAALPSSFAIPAPPNNTRSHANPIPMAILLGGLTATHFIDITW